MRRIIPIFAFIVLLAGCQKSPLDQSSNEIVVANTEKLTSKAELALLEFDLSHSSRRNNKFPNLTTENGQTPIDIPKETRKFKSTDPQIHYESFSLDNHNIENHEGEYLKIIVTGDNYITIRGKRYDLKQFHFHRDSEHAIRGKKSAMEAHLVHIAADGKIAVMGVMLTDTKRINEKIAVLFDNSPLIPGEHFSLAKNFNPKDLLPKTSDDYYSYSGSLTTPNLDNTPNPDGLTWIVFKSPSHIASTQVHEYAEIYEELNARLLQPVGDRTIWERVERD
jgi:carbonic anhydrase